jgi:cell division GTPase FtsZ
MKQKLYISLGGAGNNLLDTLINETNLITDPNKQAVYINFAINDVTDKFKGSKCIIDAGGTGRDPKVGKELTIKNLDKIKNFIDIMMTKYKDQYDSVIILSSLGGGTGASLTPFIVEFFASKIDTSVVAILPSNKEGVSTMPNAIKSFQYLYNEYVLSNKLNSLLLIDNEFYEKVGGYDTFNFKAMNREIALVLNEIFDDEKMSKSSEGYSSLDANEKKRVLFWGKGILDYGKLAFNGKDTIDDIKYTSFVYANKYKLNTAKAVALQVIFKNKVDKAKNEIQKATELISEFRKQFKNSVFYFGYIFDNPEIETDVELRFIVNGLAVPNAFTSDTKQATKAVTKLKVRNSDFETGNADLEF